MRSHRQQKWRVKSKEQMVLIKPRNGMRKQNVYGGGEKKRNFTSYAYDTSAPVHEITRYKTKNEVYAEQNISANNYDSRTDLF